VLIDWFTVAAQIVNFLILVALLRYLLYGPIVRAMDERQRSIASRWEESEEKLEQASQELERRRKQSRELDEKKQQLLEEAREEAEAAGRRRRREIRQQLDRRREAWLEEIDQQREELQRDLRRRVSRQVWRIAGHALEELAEEDLENRLASVFAGRLRTLDDETRQRVASWLRDSGRCVVRSGAELSESTRDEITEAVHRQLADDVTVEYESDELCLGVELVVEDYRVGWSVDAYLEGLQREVARALDRPDAEPEGEPSESASDATAGARNA
jgi:F-type H+-transporting ATPase subunit b